MAWMPWCVPPGHLAYSNHRPVKDLLPRHGTTSVLTLAASPVPCGVAWQMWNE